MKTETPAEAKFPHGPWVRCCRTRVAALGPLLSGAHNPQIQSPRDILSAQGRGILCLSFPIRGRVECPSDARCLSSSPQHHFEVTKKSPSISNTVLPTPPLIRQTAVADVGSQLSLHLNENSRPALSGFACWKMLVSGPDWIFGSTCQLAPTRRRIPESAAPAIAADMEKQGVGEDPQVPPETWQPLPQLWVLTSWSDPSY